MWGKGKKKKKSKNYLNNKQNLYPVNEFNVDLLFISGFANIILLFICFKIGNENCKYIPNDNIIDF